MKQAPPPALVILAAGGTGGHMFPAEALARTLQARGLRVALVTDTRGGAFGDSLPDVEVHRIHAGRLGRDLMVRVRAVFDMGLGFFEARTLLGELRPAAVVGFGGYPSIPTVIAATMRKIPVVLHEQNALLGRANRRLASRARVIATSFAHVARLPASTAAATTGNPVRPGILAVRERAYAKPEPDGPLSIFVMGGSQGAHVFAEVVPAAMARLPASLKKRIRIVQQCRPEDLDETRAAFSQGGVQAELSSFFTDVPDRLAACHLVISRSGASTVAELGVAGRPAILVPYPFATDDHQAANAESCAEGGGAWVIGQRAFTPATLADRIETLMTMPDELARAAAAARASGLPDAASRLADLVIAQIGNREGGMGPFDSPQRRDMEAAA
ncbi:MAG TPA: undecaprenyldiphospho-muramoylpentapeptide beta-N-acetylglucosaminyltransferase [Alphaproteobacteria bacterium]|nr:undecaprenyldiphospho-muramoylpentapeptide beta-N-acetylglucosaminyltransferase [Alphaproteobacteria bacterium]